ncbi:MAG TPA: hypothetical protein DD381_08075 [Lentisphaeria bacterium]|nr:MAG: hypothetical protein A2X47_04640 [Lentisphaerae bacterium GWF2_38_69]HBM16279.1 hypothetical protein [Lentisphaeria bacterium]
MNKYSSQITDFDNFVAKFNLKKDLNVLSAIAENVIVGNFSFIADDISTYITKKTNSSKSSASSYIKGLKKL